MLYFERNDKKKFFNTYIYLQNFKTLQAFKIVFVFFCCFFGTEGGGYITP